MDGGFIQPIIDWNNRIDYFTLDSRGNIYFVSENKIYKWHYDHNYTSPIPLNEKTRGYTITWVHMIEETDNLLVVFNSNSIYSVRDEKVVFKIDYQSISKVIHFRDQTLLLIMDGDCFILTVATDGATETNPIKKIKPWYHHCRTAEIYYLKNIVNVSIDLHGVLYVSTADYDGNSSSYYRIDFLNSQKDEYYAKWQVSYTGFHLATTQYRGCVQELFHYSPDNFHYLPFSHHPYAVLGNRFMVVKDRIENDKTFFKRKKITCYQSFDEKDQRLSMENKIKCIQIDKDKNGIMLLDNSIQRIQFYEPSSTVIQLTKDLAKLCPQKIPMEITDLNPVILSVRMTYS